MPKFEVQIGDQAKTVGTLELAVLFLRSPENFGNRAHPADTIAAFSRIFTGVTFETLLGEAGGRIRLEDGRRQVQTGIQDLIVHVQA